MHGVWLQPFSQQKAQFFPQVPPHPSEWGNWTHASQNGSQHPVVTTALQSALHEAVPPWNPSDVQVGTPAVPSHASPAPTAPLPQHDPLALQDPVQLEAQVRAPVQRSATVELWHEVGQV